MSFKPLYLLWTEHEQKKGGGSRAHLFPDSSEVWDIRLNRPLVPCCARPSTFVLRGVYPDLASAKRDHDLIHQVTWEEWLAHMAKTQPCCVPPGPDCLCSVETIEPDPECPLHSPKCIGVSGPTSTS